MSSPETGKVKRASGTPRHLLKARKPASDEGMSKQDKANFVKAMLEGVKAKPAKRVAKAGKAKAADGQPKVEILRKIPAPVVNARPATPESTEATKLASILEAKLAAGELGTLTPEAMQALMAVLCKLYAANVDMGDRYPIVGHRMAISGTEAMVVCGALLKAVDLQVFELGMWLSWSGG